MEILDLKKLIKFQPDRISRDMLSDKPEMRIALMCLNEGQKLEPHKAPLRLLMYCVQGKGTFIVGDERIEADEKTCILCDPMVPLTALKQIRARNLWLWLLLRRLIDSGYKIQDA